MVSLGLGRVSRSHERRREELVRAGVEERRAPEAWGPATDTWAGGLNCKIRAAAPGRQLLEGGWKGRKGVPSDA